MMYRVSAVLLALAAVLFVTGCGSNQCDFHERCSGNVRQVCGDGPDQMVGREVHEFPCADPNPVCVEINDGSSTAAQCVQAADSTCEASTFAQSCQDQTAIRCQNGYTVAEDCSSDGPDCAMVDGNARCLMSPATPCTADFQEHCDGDVRVYCRNPSDGYVTREDCTAQSRVCRTQTSGSTGSTYCMSTAKL